MNKIGIRMRMYLLLWGALMLFACSKKNPHFNETRQADLYLNSGKVYYYKEYSRPASLINAEKELTRSNSPNGGIQIKEISETKIQGVLLSYPMDWNSSTGIKIKASEEMKKPMNAIFEVVKSTNGYKVTVQNMWFTNDWKHTQQENVVLEKYIIDEKGFSFRKDQNTIRIIQHICQRLESLFLLNTMGVDQRF
ncbi:MAG TPA: hypothetical protein PLQ57_05275 [Saprospiraceae bacterium]|nr:hypothetical protein [Saprospiraceae bacterium]HRG20416.1 hypothetical protein [Saprospiraceae bacterium]